MVLNQDFKEFIQSLNDNNVRYLVIGGYAVAYHGHPRYTKDIDVWIEVNPENAANMIKALDDFGFSSLGLKAEDFLDLGEVIQLGYPDGIKIWQMWRICNSSASCSPLIERQMCKS